MKRIKPAKKHAKRESPIVFLVRDPNAKSFVAVESPNRTGSYVAFFENEHGERFTLEVQRRLRTGLLRAVDGGSPAICLSNNSIEGGAVLSEIEFQWLSACWYAALGTKLRPQDAQPAMWAEANRQNGI